MNEKSKVKKYRIQKEFTRAHFVQSLMAAVFILLVFIIMDRLKSQMAIASLGASTAIAFSFPRSQSARPRYLIGGYCMGVMAGLVGNLSIYWFGFLPLPISAHVVGCAVAVFITMMLMTILNYEHPPSAALSIAVATAEDPVLLGFAALVSIFLLCLIKYLMRNHLENL